MSLGDVSVIKFTIEEKSWTIEFKCRAPKQFKLDKEAGPGELFPRITHFGLYLFPVLREINHVSVALRWVPVNWRGVEVVFVPR